MKALYLLIPLAPLAGAIVAGFFGRAIGRTWTHRVTIASVLAAFLASCYVFNDVLEIGFRDSATHVQIRQMRNAQPAMLARQSRNGQLLFLDAQLEYLIAR